MELYFATANPDKVREIQAVVPHWVRIKSIKELGITEDIPETAPTISENSLQKAQYVFKRFNVACIADDTGLEIESLNGEPGVFSARYAGPSKNSEDNMALVLEKLKNVTNRKARFLTVLSLIDQNGQILQFEGIVEGVILSEKRGSQGFGYDPIFLPKGKRKTFAEMPLEEKNMISHRGKAIKKLIDHLETIKDP